MKKNEEVIKEVVEEVVKSEVEVKSMRKRIIELGKEGKLSKVGIERKMRSEGYDKIRYAYIFVVLKDKGIKVPNEVRTY